MLLSSADGIMALEKNSTRKLSKKNAIANRNLCLLNGKTAVARLCLKKCGFQP
jgi:hypothetical protein